MSTPTSSTSPSPFRRDHALSDLALERYLLGELSHEESEQIEKHLKDSPHDHQRLNAMKQLNQELSQRLHPPTQLRDQVDSSLPSPEVKSSFWLNPWVWLTPVGLALVLLVGGRLFWSAPLSSPSAISPHTLPLNPYGTLRTKGSSVSWEVYAEHSSKTKKNTPLKSGGVIYPGQKVAFRLFPKQEGYYMIIGKDSKNEWYLGAPPASSDLGEQQEAQKINLPNPPNPYIDLEHALEFDDQLGTEQLFLFYCQAALPFSTLKRALKKNQSTLPDSLSKQCHLTSFSLIKKTPSSVQ